MDAVVVVILPLNDDDDNDDKVLMELFGFVKFTDDKVCIISGGGSVEPDVSLRFDDDTLYILLFSLRGIKGT